MAALAQKDAEIEKLKADAASSDEAMEAQFRKFEECPHTVAFNKDGSSLCGCSFDRPGDVCAHHAPALRDAQRDLTAARLRIERLEDVLRKIVAWEMPASGHYWDDGSAMSYAVAYGSNGERDYIISDARGALDGNGG
jgi:hypothetical protein